MENKFTKIPFEMVFEVNSIITIFYMELSKEFRYDGESHDFWELVYIDSGEMICTSEDDQFTLKSGELIFHKPNEFHNLAGDGISSPNISIISFDCDSPSMYDFAGKIFKLTPDERTFLSMFFKEGILCYRMENEYNPLIEKMYMRDDAPFGCSQMTTNLLEVFLIMLSRNKIIATKPERKSYVIDGVAVPSEVKQILDIMKERIYTSLTINDISNTLNRSESYIKKLFKKYYSGGIIKYYNSLKIKEARRLIRNGEHSIEEISNMLGFDSPQYFSHCFKQFTHLSPSQYKKSIIR